MEKRTNRVQTPHRLQQQDISLLLRGLNGEWHKPNVVTRRMLLQVVPDIGRIVRIVLKLQRLVTHPPDWLVDLESKTLKDIHDNFESQRSAYRHIQQLNDELSEYRTFPHIAQMSGGGWRFQWSVAYQGDMEKGVVDARRTEELPLVVTAIRLAEQGLIVRVRRCPIDRKWFYARTQASRFCSTKCRDAFHQQDPKDKERRRKWARDNYQTRKTLEIGSTIVAVQRKTSVGKRKSK